MVTSKKLKFKKGGLELFRKSKFVKGFAGLLVLMLILLTGCSTQAKSSNPQSAPAPAAKSPEVAKQVSPFEGKTIKIIVPNSPGGGHDTGARALAPYLQKYSGAKNVIVENQKGAGGILGMNSLWNSKGDGLTIMFASGVTQLLTYISGDTSVQFDPAKTTWLARAIQKPRVLTLGKKTGVNSAADLAKMNRPFIYPAVGLDDDFYTFAVIAHSLGLQMKTVTGFGGDSECQVAQIQGSVDGLFTTLQTAGPAVKAGDLVPIMVLSGKRIKEYPDLPTVIESTTGDGKQAMEDIVAISDLYECFWGPPNMDPVATEAWRNIMEKVFKDPEVNPIIEKVQGTPAFARGEEVQKMVADLIARTTKEMKPIFETAAAAVK